MAAARRSSAVLSALVLATLSCDVTQAPSAPALHTAEASVEVEAEVARIRTALGALERGLLPDEIEAVARTISSECRRAGLPPALVLAVIGVESGGDAFAVSPVGALGLMQLMPRTARAVAREHGLPWEGPRTLSDPVANVRLGVRYLAHLLTRYDDVETALAAYNWGPGRIGERLRAGRALPVEYARRVLRRFGSLDRAV